MHGESERGGEARATGFEIARDEFRRVRVRETDLPSPELGEALCEVERFAFSANNLTYALLGERLDYWRLFPAPAGWGQIPVWGYLRVAASRAEGVEPGRRLFGLCPMSSHVVLRPARVGELGFVDASEHRLALPAAYNAYSWLERDPAYAQRLEDELLVLRPLFWLSLMLEDLICEEQLLTGERAVLITSASSKAAIGTAHLLAGRGVSVTGLTSQGHAGFVAGLRVYDRVVAYDRVGELPSATTVLLDIAGNAGLRAELKRHLGAALEHTVVAGATHLDARAADLAPAGADASFLFVPDRMRRRAGELGWAELNGRYTAALRAFADGARRWLRITRAGGPVAVELAYVQTLDNAAAPDAAFVLSLADRAAVRIARAA